MVSMFLPGNSELDWSSEGCCFVSVIGFDVCNCFDLIVKLGGY